MYTIYALEDPQDNAIRYVGMTNDVYARFSQHIRCEGANIAKDAWIQQLKDEQVMVIMRTLEVAETLEEAREREDYWIKHYLSQGAYLLNMQIAKSFTYEDFLQAFGGKKPKTERKPKEVIKGDIAKQIARIVKRNPAMGPSEIARKVGVSRGYASRIKSRILAEIQQSA